MFKAHRVAGLALVALIALTATCCALERAKRSPGELIRNTLRSARDQLQADLKHELDIKGKVENEAKNVARRTSHEALLGLHIDDNAIRNHARNLRQQGPIKWSRQQVKHQAKKILERNATLRKLMHEGHELNQAKHHLQQL